MACRSVINASTGVSGEYAAGSPLDSMSPLDSQIAWIHINSTSNTPLEREPMQTPKRIVPYPLRLDKTTRKEAEEEAHQNRRSLNAELGLLIEEALLSRKQGRPRA